jgi:hypothetical protein
VVKRSATASEGLAEEFFRRSAPVSAIMLWARAALSGKKDEKVEGVKEAVWAMPLYEILVAESDETAEGSKAEGVKTVSLASAGDSPNAAAMLDESTEPLPVMARGRAAVRGPTELREEENRLKEPVIEANTERGLMPVLPSKVQPAPS